MLLLLLLLLHFQFLLMFDIDYIFWKLYLNGGIAENNKTLISKIELFKMRVKVLIMHSKWCVHIHLNLTNTTQHTLLVWCDEWTFNTVLFIFKWLKCTNEKEITAICSCILCTVDQFFFASHSIWDVSAVFLRAFYVDAKHRPSWQTVGVLQCQAIYCCVYTCWNMLVTFIVIHAHRDQQPNS